MDNYLIELILAMDARLKKIESDITEIKQTGDFNETRLKKILAGQKDIAAANTEILARLDEEFLSRKNFFPASNNKHNENQ